MLLDFGFLKIGLRLLALFALFGSLTTRLFAFGTQLFTLCLTRRLVGFFLLLLFGLGRFFLLFLFDLFLLRLFLRFGSLGLLIGLRLALDLLFVGGSARYR